MKHVESYNELEVYKLSKELSRRIFEITKKFPKEEMYSLTDQVRRSSRSIGKMLHSMMNKSHLFCINEDEPVYGLGAENRLPITDY